jgi:hypothetical protein
MAAKTKKQLHVVTQTYQCDLKIYPTRRMYCPVQGKMVTAYGIPVGQITRAPLNPGRPGGTDQANVNSVYNKLVTSPDGQEEPCSAAWDSASGMWDLVFGWNRTDGVQMAQANSMVIANSPNYELWIVPFLGTPGEKGRLQLRENANKKGGKESTAIEVATMLANLAILGEMDQTGSPFKGCDDAEKRKRCLAVVNVEAPQWGGTTFSSVWKYLGNKNGGTNSLGLKFKQWPNKYELSQYFIAHNSLGITDRDVLASPNAGNRGLDANGDVYFQSGFYLDKNGKRYLFYIAVNKSEIAGALPTNATKMRIKNKADYVIVLVACNKTNAKGIHMQRQSFADEATWWNKNALHVFDELYFIAQTSPEISTNMLKGQWTRHDKL